MMHANRVPGVVVWLLVAATAACGGGDGPSPPDGGADGGDADDAESADGGADDAGGSGDALDVGGNEGNAGDIAGEDEVSPSDGGGGVAEFTSVPPTLVQAGEVWVYAPEVRGGSGITMEESPPEATFDGTTARWPAPRADVGSGAFVFAAPASGGTDDGAFQSFTVEVNHAPIWLSEPGDSALQGSVYTFAPRVADPDRDLATWTLDAHPAWAILSGEEIVGTPDVAGRFPFTATARDDRGGATQLTWTVDVHEGLRGLTVVRPLLTTGGGRIELSGCCFDTGMTADLGVWSGALQVERAGRAAVDVSWSDAGQHTLRIYDASDRLLGEAEIVVVPVAESDGGVVRTTAVSGVPSLRDAATLAPVDTAVAIGSATDHLTPRAPAGPVAVERSGVLSDPVVAGGAAVVVDVAPAFAAPGATQTFRFAAAPDAPITVTWRGAAPAACMNIGGDACEVRVPAGAAGVPTVRADDELVPLVAAASADAVDATEPAIFWRSHLRVARDRTTLIRVRHVGLDSAATVWEADGGDVTTLWADRTDAVVSVRATDDVVIAAPRIGARRGARIGLVATRPAERVAGASSAWAGADGWAAIVEGELYIDGAPAGCVACDADGALVVSEGPTILDLARGTLTHAATAETSRIANADGLRVSGRAPDAVFATRSGRDVWALPTRDTASVLGVTAGPGSFTLVAADPRDEAPVRATDALLDRVAWNGADALLAVARDGSVSAGALLRIQAGSIAPIVPTGAGVPPRWAAPVGAWASGWLVQGSDGAIWYIAADAAAWPTGLGGPGDLDADRFGVGAASAAEGRVVALSGGNARLW